MIGRWLREWVARTLGPECAYGHLAAAAIAQAIEAQPLKEGTNHV